MFKVAAQAYSVLSDEADNVATTSSDFETTYNEDEIYDPIEPINRAIFGFNNIADKIILEPAAKILSNGGRRPLLLWDGWRMAKISSPEETPWICKDTNTPLEFLNAKKILKKISND